MTAHEGFRRRTVEHELCLRCSSFDSFDENGMCRTCGHRISPDDGATMAVADVDYEAKTYTLQFPDD